MLVFPIMGKSVDISKVIYGVSSTVDYSPISYKDLMFIYYRALLGGQQPMWNVRLMRHR